MTLIYVGQGRFIPGVPARDLRPDEVETFGIEYLLETGLYDLPPADDEEE